MDPLAADPWSGSQVLANVVVADTTRLGNTAVMVTAIVHGHAARLAHGWQRR
jgi:hypothetical protein